MRNIQYSDLVADALFIEKMRKYINALFNKADQREAEILKHFSNRILEIDNLIVLLEATSSPDEDFMITKLKEKRISLEHIVNFDTLN